MRCLACNESLSDREANRKYPDHERIKNPEDRYIMLCDPCIKETDLVDVIPDEIILKPESHEEVELE